MHSSTLSTVFVAHSQPVVSAGLLVVLQAESDFIPLERRFDIAPGSLDSRAEVAPLADADVIICDYETGIHLLGRLANVRVPQEFPKILIVTHLETEGHIRFALDAGVHGYLLLESALVELAAAVRDLRRGSRYLSQAVSGRIVEGLLGPSLTKRELQVLRLAGQGSSNKVIASRLSITVGTVKSHMRTVLDKFGATNRVEAAGMAERRGLLRESVPRAATSAVASSQSSNSA